MRNFRIPLVKVAGLTTYVLSEITDLENFLNTMR